MGYEVAYLKAFFVKEGTSSKDGEVAVSYWLMTMTAMMLMTDIDAH